MEKLIVKMRKDGKWFAFISQIYQVLDMYGLKPKDCSDYPTTSTDYAIRDLLETCEIHDPDDELYSHVIKEEEEKEANAHTTGSDDSPF